MKERILFVCVGQGGSNIGQLFEDKGYNCIFINTSNDDLNTIKAKDKFHIPKAKGCSKDRQVALEYVKNYYQIITDVIDANYPSQDIVYFIFSLGGGTGSGLSPVLLDVLSYKNPDKHYGAITIIPSLNESIKTQINAVEAYKQLININQLKTLFVLDNNNEDKFIINNKFVNLFDKLINITNPNVKGIIDKAELNTLLTCKGNVYMSNDIQSILNQWQDNSIFTRYEQGCKYIALSLKDEIDIASIEKMTGTPYDIFVGFNDEENFITVTGSSYPHKRIEQLMEFVNSKQYEIINMSNDLNFDLLKIKNDLGKTPESNRKEKIDYNSLFAKYAG